MAPSDMNIIIGDNIHFHTPPFPFLSSLYRFTSFSSVPVSHYRFPFHPQGSPSPHLADNHPHWTWIRQKEETDQLWDGFPNTGEKGKTPVKCDKHFIVMFLILSTACVTVVEFYSIFSITHWDASLNPWFINLEFVLGEADAELEWPAPRFGCFRHRAEKATEDREGKAEEEDQDKGEETVSWNTIVTSLVLTIPLRLWKYVGMNHISPCLGVNSRTLGCFPWLAGWS